MLIFIQTLLISMKKITFYFIRRTNFSDSMISMICIIIISVLFIIYCRKKEISLSVFPKQFDKFYILITFVAIILFLVTPSNYNGDVEPKLLLIYGSVVIPIFEELIFRGYVWNKLNEILKKELFTYVVTTILFGLWHLGYISSIAFRVNISLVHIMFWKVVTGVSFGIVLGALRLKTKNCYSTMVLHGILNIFGR